VQACCGSDVFGTDICTCRPYLVYAIQGAVEIAKRGGVGVIVYFRKEGRSLGEVVKFRVYNGWCCTRSVFAGPAVVF
jgi:GTP cyclohydrolase II